jgi:prepilin-type N-terminal cleavage/methylation domain-containing protein
MDLTRFSPLRLGFSMLEVMISVAIMSTALAMVGGLMYTLHQGRSAIDEEIKVQAIAHIITERLQGSQWDDLGRDIADYPNRNSWSWHRRATKQLAILPSMDPTVTPPMQDNAPRAVDDLVKSGILSEPSGVRELKVYLEYYQMKLIDQMSITMSAVPTPDPRKVWTAAVGDPIQGLSPSDANKNDLEIFLPEDPTRIDLSVLAPAVVMRVLISWESAVGGTTRWHEVVIARRK